jgi:hypothetical protein
MGSAPDFLDWVDLRAAARPGGMAGPVSRRIATAVCVTGLAVFSALLFSSSLISGFNNYGPIGAMSTLLSYFVGLGVCIHLGAVFGRLWNERRGTRRESSPSRQPGTAIPVVSSATSKGPPVRQRHGGNSPQSGPILVAGDGRRTRIDLGFEWRR